MKTLLSIDCGTQSTRTMLFDAKGKLLALKKILYEPYQSPQPGWAEQDAKVYWNAVVEGCRYLKANHSDAFNAIAGIGVTTMRSAMVNLDKNGQPLRPAIVWLDQRKADEVHNFSGFFKVVFKVLRLEEIMTKLQQQGKSNWLKQKQPDIWQKTYKYVQLSGYLNHRLTGEFKDSVASQIGHIPFDYRKQTWGNPDNFMDFASKIYPIERDKLPELVNSCEVLGHVTKEASDETGIPVGIPVIACGSDKGCETLGMGVLDQEMASLSFGTTASIQTTTSSYVEPQRFMPAYPALKPGYYNPEIEIFRGFWMITWFKNEFAHKEVQEAQKRGISAEKALDELLEHSPPGAMGLMVQPYWSPGLFEPEAKGAMIGFGDVHKKAYVYRAVIEGLAYGLLDGRHRLEKNTKTRFKRLAVSGGASQSDEICQISADIFNLELVRGETWETSGLGAAITASVGIGLHDNIDEAVKAMVHYTTTFKPNPGNVELYNKLYTKVYKKMYPALKGIYKNIREITGYPGD